MKIAFMTADEKGGCPHYRIYQPSRVINRVFGKEHTAVVVDKYMEQELADAIFANADIYVFQSTFNKKFQDIAKVKPVIFEIDDLMWDNPPLQGNYKDWGVSEVQWEDPNTGEKIWLWKNGVNGFYPMKNAERIELVKRNLAASTAVTVTTEALREFYLPINPNVYAIQNCIDFDLWPETTHKKDGRIRILWHGGEAHYQDIFIIKNVFRKIIEKYDHVDWIMMGSFWPKFFEGIPEHRYKVYKWTCVHAHSYRMICMNADIGIAPLKDTSFNRGKSPLKWMEYSAMRVPTVASDTVVYPEEIEDGVTGLLAGSEDDWMEKISYLIENEEARKRIGQEAYDDVYERFNFEKNIHKWIEVYQKVLGEAHGEAHGEANGEANGEAKEGSYADNSR